MPESNDNNIPNQIEKQSEIVLYQSDNGISLEVRMNDDTVWLSTQQMSQLFKREESNIRRHIIKIFNDGELKSDNNVHFLHVNGVKKPVNYHQHSTSRDGFLRGRFLQGPCRTRESCQDSKDTHYNQSHDRWLIIDNLLYHCGHSHNANGGHKISAINLMGTSPEFILKEME